MTGGLGRDVFVLALPGEEVGGGGGGHAGETGTFDLLAAAAHEGEDGHEGCIEGVDVVTDFKQGTDSLALAGGLTFEQLGFLYDDLCGGTLLFVMSGHDHEQPTLAATGEDDGELGRRLAFLEGFSGTLRQSDFITCADLPLV